MRVGVTFVVLGAAIAAASLAGGGCGGSDQLTGSGGAGMIMTGRGGGAGASGTGASGAAGAGATGAAGTGFDDCRATSFEADIVPPDILIVLDTSASMNDGFAFACSGGCGANSKWAAVVGAIESVVDGSTPAIANWGLELMSNPGDACDAGNVAVSPGPATGAQIRAALESRSTPPALASPGNRPTRAAIDVAVAKGLGAIDPGQQIVVLVTDGEPGCKPGAADPLASDASGAIQATTNAHTAGISTCIIGLFTAGGPADATLAQMAPTGSGCPVAPDYVSISAGAPLADLLNAIAAQGGACRYAIPPAPTTTTTRSMINVLLNGTQIPQDANDGWTYANADQSVLILHGAACEASQGQPISIVFACLAV